MKKLFRRFIDYAGHDLDLFILAGVFVLLIVGTISLVIGKFTYDYIYADEIAAQISNNYKIAKNFATENENCSIRFMGKPKHHMPRIECSGYSFYVVVPKSDYDNMSHGGPIKIQAVDKLCHRWEDCVGYKPGR